MEKHGGEHVYALPSRSRLKSKASPSELSQQQHPGPSVVRGEGRIAMDPYGRSNSQPMSSPTPILETGTYRNSLVGRSPRLEFSPPLNPRHSINETLDKATTSPAAFPPVQSRRYNCGHWALVSLKRSASGQQSVPTSPSLEYGPASPGSPNSSCSCLVAVLLHVPTQVLYAWPIALKGVTKGVCTVTQPATATQEADSFDERRVLSESLKVLSDVIQAWIKTQPMREALRRKESLRQKGVRKIGESEQDAAWLNDGLGLAQLDDDARAWAKERSWREQGESVDSQNLSYGSQNNSPTMSPSGPRSWPSPLNIASSGPPSANSSPARSVIASFALPPAQTTTTTTTSFILPPSPASSHTGCLDSLPSMSSSSGTGTPAIDSPLRPSTPRIEVSMVSEEAEPSGMSAATSPATVTPHRVSSGSSTASSGKGIEDEITEWISSASLAEFTNTRPRNASSASGFGGSGSLSSPVSPGPGSPSTRSRKTVTFSHPPNAYSSLMNHQQQRMSSYRPPFAPPIGLTPEEEETDEVQPYWLNGQGNGVAASSSNRASMSSERGTHAVTSSKSHVVSHRPSRDLQDFPPVSKSTSAPGGAFGSLNGGTVPPEALLSGSSRHARTSSKLSQEVARDPGAAMLGMSPEHPKNGNGSTSGSGKLSPVQSFVDLKNAFKSFKSSKKKAQAA